MIVIMRDAVMPECCNTCVCSEGYGCGITGTLMKTKEMELRPDWCPLEKAKPCEDAVRREDVVNFLCDWICAPGVRCNESSDKCGCIRGIKALPSAQPERKKGKWTAEDCHAMTYKYCCSSCRAHHRARYDFCPTCGADMRGDSNGSD